MRPRIRFKKNKQSLIDEIQGRASNSIKESASNTINNSGHPIDRFMQENRYAETLLREMRKLIKKLERNNFDATWRQLEDFTKQLRQIDKHYKRKEEILFPYLEKYNVTDLFPAFGSDHKEIKKRLRNLSQAIKNKNIGNITSLYVSVSKLIRKVIIDEDQILFPAALSKISFGDWSEIRTKALAVGYSWIEENNSPIDRSIEKSKKTLDGFTLESGFMTLETIDLVLNNIPGEISVINEDGIIIYYNKESDRIFRRNPDMIGTMFHESFSAKNAKNVKNIFSSLKKKKEGFVELDFIEEDNHIYIKYSPLFDKNGNFCGAIESVQNITYFKDFPTEIE